MHLAALELAQLFHGKFRQGICRRADRQGNQRFIRVQAGIAVTQMIHLQMLNRVKHHRRHQVHFIRKMAQVLERIEEQRRGCPQQIGSAAGDNGAVRQLHGSSSVAGERFPL